MARKTSADNFLNTKELSVSVILIIIIAILMILMIILIMRVGVRLSDRSIIKIRILVLMTELRQR